MGSSVVLSSYFDEFVRNDPIDVRRVSIDASKELLGVAGVLAGFFGGSDDCIRGKTGFCFGVGFIF